MSTIVELLSGVLRHFPNTMLATLFVGGIALSRLTWLLVALGGLFVAILTLVVQYIFLKTMNLGPMPGAAVLDACSILPVATGATYSSVPSVWMALSSFFASYIFVNASNIYTAKPANVSNDAISVQQRKGVGLISMLAVSFLFLFLVVPRYRTPCETMMGTITGLAVGIGSGVGWWYLLNAYGSNVYPDVHGVMSALRPGSMGTPLACSKK
jgi:hypothetical protein